MITPTEPTNNTYPFAIKINHRSASYIAVFPTVDMMRHWLSGGAHPASVFMCGGVNHLARPGVYHCTGMRIIGGKKVFTREYDSSLKHKSKFIEYAAWAAVTINTD